MALVVGLAAVLASACKNNSAGGFVGGPALALPSATLGAVFIPTDIRPKTLPKSPVGVFACPLVPPLTTTFAIVVQQPSVDVFLNSVQIEFFDGFGFRGSPIPFQSGDLGVRFGPLDVRAGSTRSFLFTTGFGCFPTSPTILTAHVVMADAAGRQQESTLTAHIE